MTKDEFIAISNEINIRIYRHRSCFGSKGTIEKGKARAEEDIQILKIISKFIDREEVQDGKIN